MGRELELAQVATGVSAAIAATGIVMAMNVGSLDGALQVDATRSRASRWAVSGHACSAGRGSVCGITKTDRVG